MDKRILEGLQKRKPETRLQPYKERSKENGKKALSILLIFLGEFEMPKPERKPCPFLLSITYPTTKGKMTKHYCTARGLFDLLSKQYYETICKEGKHCPIRELVERDLKITTRQNKL